MLLISSPSLLLFLKPFPDTKVIEPPPISYTYQSDRVIKASDGEKARIAEEARIKAEEERQRQAVLASQNVRVPAVIIPKDDVANGLRAQGLSEDVVSHFVNVIVPRESGFNTNAKNPSSTASGLFQFLTGTFYGYGCLGSPFTWTDSVACAVKAYRISGFAPWAL